MQLLYFITTVTSQVHSARHHQRAGTVLYRASSCISDVAIALVYSEKTRLKKLITIIIIMNKSQEMTVFGGAPEINFRY